MTNPKSSGMMALGGTLLAAVLMVLLGIWEILAGIAAIANNEFFISGPNYTYNIDTTAWGWIHLILGVVALVAGLALFSGAGWARGVGIALAVLVAINNFLFLPNYPVWSILMIALAVFLIWSLATVRPSQEAEELIEAETSTYTDVDPQSPASPMTEQTPGTAVPPTGTQNPTSPEAAV